MALSNCCYNYASANAALIFFAPCILKLSRGMIATERGSFYASGNKVYFFVMFKNLVNYTLSRQFYNIGLRVDPYEIEPYISRENLSIFF
jgi:hypothetical protein